MSLEPVTLDNCAREPIHIPGSIQPHGLLFACRGPHLQIRQVSANVGSWLGRDAETLLGTSFLDLLDAEGIAAIEVAMQHPVLREANPLRLRLHDGEPLDVSFSRSGDTLLVELERCNPALNPAAPGFDPRLRASMLRMQAADGIAALCRIAAQEIRSITGFDRVMVYRFDAEWNGEVVAEEKLDALEPFLGLHYPASDIPEQARRLYTVNWLRLIADVAYAPVPLVPSLDPDTQAPLDLSHAVLRSVSPIHIEYLTNMGVTASMSVSLIVDGELVGLVACHNYRGPRIVEATARESAEFLARALSWQLGVLEAAEHAKRARRTQAAEARIVRSIVAHADLLDGLATTALPSLCDASGAAVVLDDGVRQQGLSLRSAQLELLVAWLRAQPQDVVATDHIARVIPEAASWEVAGVLAVAISRELGEFVLWLRPATDRTVDWAGDPRKLDGKGEAGAPPRLSPRGSFALWRETIHGRSLPWERWELEAASNLRRVLLGGIRRRSAELRALNERLLETDRAKDAFIASVSHELRTPLNAIAGWTQLLRAGTLTPPKVDHALEVIARNAQAQQQIVDDLLDVSRITSGKVSLDIQPVDLPALVESVAEAATVALENKNLRLKRVIDPGASPILADPGRLRQIVGNVLTNAIKFTPKGGSILIVVQRLRSDVEIVVQDSGKGIGAEFLPYVFEPFRQAESGLARRSEGLGLGLAIVRKLVELHGGRVSAESDGEGLGATFRVQLPLAPLRRGADVAASAGEAVTPARARPQDLEGVRVLIVEDEQDARDLVALLFADCGATVLQAGSGPEALELLALQPVDLVVSDIGMPGMDGFELLREVRRRWTMPAIALSAHTRAVDRTRALQSGFQAHVPKPVDVGELLTVAASTVGRLDADRDRGPGV